MQIVFLGTAAMVPNKERAHSCVFFSYNGEGLLFDCGENAQRQLKIAGIPPTKVDKILISHWHGDHVLGLPGLIQTLGGSEYEKTLKIYGPKGTKGFMKNMFKAFIFDKSLINLEINEIKKERFFENKDYILEALPLEHSIASLGYSLTEKDRRKINLGYIRALGIPDGPLLGKLQQGQSIVFKGKEITPSEATQVVKGKKITYIADTVPCANAVKLAKDADLLIIEATYASDLEDRAEEYGHLTAKQAATIATQANVKKLVLTHFSNRYKTTHELEEEAKNQFREVVAAKDFMKIKL